MASKRFDLVVIGSGPAGQKGAIAAAKLGRSVALVDRRALVGGVSLHSGTIPSKTLREVILYLTGFRQRAFYGAGYTLKERITIQDLRERVSTVIGREYDVVMAQLRRNGVEVVDGLARFLDPHRVLVEDVQGAQEIAGDRILIACGTRPARDPHVPFDGEHILVADQLGAVERMPQDLIVVGAGVIGLEYASMFAALGIRVTVVDKRTEVLEFCDEEMVDALIVHMRALGTTFRLGEKVLRVWKDDALRVHCETQSGRNLTGDALLYTVGRQVNTDTLDLPAAGLTCDERGRLTVNGAFQTAVPHIYAAGDVIGFPALASTSMQQGRRAAECMFATTTCSLLEHLPYGIYTIPEISMVGRTESELRASNVPYETGIARYGEIAKGQMVGDQSGKLKILFQRETLEVLGVHVIGESAAEIVHIGQAVIALHGTLEYFRDAVFNYPTFAEAYKVAALNGLNKVGEAAGPRLAQKA
jgi:NAD(P) transhydrogenase